MLGVVFFFFSFLKVGDSSIKESKERRGHRGSSQRGQTQKPRAPRSQPCSWKRRLPHKCWHMAIKGSTPTHTSPWNVRVKIKINESFQFGLTKCVGGRHSWSWQLMWQLVQWQGIEVPCLRIRMPPNVILNPSLNDTRDRSSMQRFRGRGDAFRSPVNLMSRNSGRDACFWSSFLRAPDKGSSRPSSHTLINWKLDS